MEQNLVSSLETFDVVDGQRRVVYGARRHFEAPNWSRDGGHFLINSEGRLFRLSHGCEPQPVDTGALSHLNNDHGISPDGNLIAVSDNAGGASRISIVPAAGGTPRLVTPQGPSYWHGWSPDGTTLAYVAARDGSRHLNIYACPAQGGVERQLTDVPALDDGPDYSADGRMIYFNSARTGNMKLWRMSADGSRPEQLTFEDNTRDWFPHPSPDGQWIVFLSFGTDVGVSDHPPNRQVSLRIMPTDGGAPRVLTTLFGGQGTINVPSWSPDSRRFAFVSYRLI